MQTLAEQQAFLRKKKVVVKFKHLNPELQETIGERFFQLLQNFFTIRNLRTFRTIYEGVSISNIADLVRNKQGAIGRPGDVFFSVVGPAGRTVFAKMIQLKHEELVEKMNSHGILSPQHEKHYPPDWIKPAEVARTHPIFYVAMNGDLVFLKENARERLRWKAQRTRPVKYLGLNPWRWRAYLRPPKALQPIGEKVKGILSKVRGKASAWGTKPVPQKARASFYKRK